MTSKNLSETFKTALLAAGLAGAAFFLWGTFELNLSDEGFLWYGAVHTHLGEVPIRDFQAYDPGRYYWISFFFTFLGDKLKALRFSMFCFDGVALFFGLSAARRVVKSWIGLTALAAAMILWMILPFRPFEYGIPMIAIFFLARLIEKPTIKRHFAAGVFTGIAAFMGTNHGVYALLANILAMAIVAKEDRRRLAGKATAFFSGVFIGYLPMLAMFAFVPGFFDSYLTNFLGYFHHGTNLQVSNIPWLWDLTWKKICDNSSPGYSRVLEVLHEAGAGIFLLVLPVFYLGSAFFLALRRRPLSEAPLWAACAFVGGVYLHHVFSRGDLYHLMEGGEPFVIGIPAFAFYLEKRSKTQLVSASLVLLLVSSLAFAGSKDAFYYRYFIPKKILAKYVLRGEGIWMTRYDGDYLRNIVKAIQANVKEDENVLVIPDWSAVYCLLRKKSPIHDIYSIFPASEAVQKKAIADLEQKKVNWVMFNASFSQMFPVSDPILWDYLLKNFVEVPAQGSSSIFFLLHRKPAGSASAS